MGRRAPGGWERRAGAERRAVAATGLGDILYPSLVVWSYQRDRIFPTKSSYYSSTSYF